MNIQAIAFGQFIRDLRLKNGLKKRELARRVHCDVKTISNIEDRETWQGIQDVNLYGLAIEFKYADYPTMILDWERRRLSGESMQDARVSHPRLSPTTDSLHSTLSALVDEYGIQKVLAELAKVGQGKNPPHRPAKEIDMSAGTGQTAATSKKKPPR